MARPQFAFATLLTSDSYLPGALTAIHSLKDVEGATPANDYDTICLVTPASVSPQAIKQLRSVFDLVVGVDAIETTSFKELALLGRPDLKASLTKLHAWRLVQYKKVLFLDADTLVLRPLSHLFTTTPSGPRSLSAAPDVGWPDCFNSGVMVLHPDHPTFDALLARASTQGSWDGGDQGLLNDHFEDWNRLSFGYNVTPSNSYQYKPALQRYGHSVSVLHFIGASKPWHRLHRARPATYTLPQEATPDYEGFLHRWYDVYERHYGQQSTASFALSAHTGRFNPTKGHFVVPTYSNAWDQPVHVAYRPPSPEELKTMFGGALAHQSEYATMPLSQPDLRPSAPEHRVEPPAPLPEALWDPAKSGPEGYTGVQMAQPFIEHCENVWDQGTPESRQFFQPPAYNPIPSDLQSHYASVMNASAPRVVFPWEEGRKGRAQPSRTFPDSPRPPTVPLPNLDPVASPPAPSSRANALSYSNAWDSIKGIKQYAESLTQPNQQKQWRASVTGRDPNDTALKQKHRHHHHHHHHQPQPPPAHPQSTRRYSSERESHGEEGDDEEDEEERPPIRFRHQQEAGSHNGNSPSPSRANVALPPRRSLARRLQGSDDPLSRRSTRSGGDKGSSRPPSMDASNLRAAASTPYAAPAAPSRVFSPATDTGIVRKEGLAALERFMRSMEEGGAAAAAATRSESSSATAAPNQHKVVATTPRPPPT